MSGVGIGVPLPFGSTCTVPESGSSDTTLKLLFWLPVAVGAKRTVTTHSAFVLRVPPAPAQVLPNSVKAAAAGVVTLVTCRSAPPVFFTVTARSRCCATSTSPNTTR